MVCCFLSAMLMGQLFAVWNMRRKIALFVVLISITALALTLELQRHRDHVQQFVWDVQAMLRGEDPAIAALSQPVKNCSANSINTNVMLAKADH